MIVSVAVPVGDIIRRHTAPLGPFWAHGPRLPEGVLGVTAVAQRARVSGPTVIRWHRLGRLPEPDFVTARGPRFGCLPQSKTWLSTSDAFRPAECAAPAACRSRTTLGRCRAFLAHPKRGCNGGGARRWPGRGRGLPMMGVLTLPNRKASTCVTLPSLALTCGHAGVSADPAPRSICALSASLPGGGYGAHSPSSYLVGVRVPAAVVDRRHPQKDEPPP